MPDIIIGEERLDRFAIRRIRAYGIHTLENRALVDRRDGLKPVQRRILWGMHKMGLADFVKSARIVGNVMGAYHPHGSDAIYSTMVNMANVSEPAVIGMGGFGAHNTRPSAMRYTETKLSEFGKKCFLDPMYLNVAEMTKNYDGSELEPIHLPAAFPYLLLNGMEGIAVGLKGQLPPFHKEGVITLIRQALEGKPVTVKDCKKHLRLNYPYGGRLEDVDRLYEFFESGESTIKVQPKYSIDGNTIRFTEVPPYFRAEVATERLQKLPAVKSAADYTNFEKFDYVVELFSNLTTKEKDAAVEKIINAVSNHLVLRCNMTQRNSGEDQNIEDIDILRFPFYQYFEQWATWRTELEVKAQNFILKTLQERISRTNLLILACNNLDAIFRILKRSMKPKEELMVALKLKAEEAETILRLTLNSLSRLNLQVIEKEQLRLQSEVKKTLGIIKSPVSTVVTKIESFA